MTFNDLNKKIYDLYGKVNYEIITYTNMRSQLQIKCLDCGNLITIKYASNFFKKTRKNFCPYCANTYKGNKIGIILPLEEAQKRIDEKYPNEYKIIKEKYNGWSHKCIIQHKCGKYFSCQPRDLLYHSHCPCFNIISKGENKIKKILEKYNIEYRQQERLNEMKKSPFDFYLPKYNLLIEFQGRQHYEAVEKFGGELQLKKQKQIDKRKKEIALKDGYNILYISYKEMSQIENILVQRLSLTGVETSVSKEQTS